jgi:hypothetical protein
VQRPHRRRSLGVAAILLLTLFVGSFLGTARAGSQRFTDVGANHPFHQQIDWIAGNGIASGFPDGTYRPGAPVSRQAMAAFIGRTSDSFRLIESVGNPAPGTEFTTWVLCPLRGRAIAGGGRVDVPDTFLAESSSDLGGHGWRVRFETEDGVQRDPSELHLWLLCVPDDSDVPLE